MKSIQLVAVGAWLWLGWVGGGGAFSMPLIAIQILENHSAIPANLYLHLHEWEHHSHIASILINQRLTPCRRHDGMLYSLYKTWERNFCFINCLLICVFPGAFQNLWTLSMFIFKAVWRSLSHNDDYRI